MQVIKDEKEIRIRFTIVKCSKIINLLLGDLKSLIEEKSLKSLRFGDWTLLLNPPPLLPPPPPPPAASPPALCFPRSSWLPGEGDLYLKTFGWIIGLVNYEYKDHFTFITNK